MNNGDQLPVQFGDGFPKLLPISVTPLFPLPPLPSKRLSLCPALSGAGRRGGSTSARLRGFDRGSE
eukprot:2049920-Rhodomonas_salina.1